jgi:putative N6-adenine-specific DNA methylase
MSSGWDAKSPIIDPFCGSGTILIEAALIARRMAPGRHRDFQFMQWPSFDTDGWHRLLKGHDADVLERCPPLLGADRDAGAVDATLDNAEAAGVGSNLEVVRRTVSDLVVPAGRRGWVIANPPYGGRVGGEAGSDLRDLYARFGAVLRERAIGWHVAVLASRDTPVAQMRLPLAPTITFSNGGIEVAAHTGVVPG